MAASYVDQFEGGYRVAGTRISLDSIVYAFNSGHSPETIAQSFPVLTLEQVYGSIATTSAIARRSIATSSSRTRTTRPNGRQRAQPTRSSTRNSRMPAAGLPDDSAAQGLRTPAGGALLA